MPITPRASVVRGPAIIQFQSQTFYTKQDFVMRPMLKLGPVQTSMFGTVGQSVVDFLWSLSFVPDGQLIDAHIPVLWPYATTYPGASMFGATDSDVVIWTKAGVKITFKAGAVTQMPNLFFGPGETILGACTMMCVGKLATAFNAAAKWAELAATAFADASFNPALIKKMAYVGTWGASPWDAFEQEAGFRVTFNVASTPDVVSGATHDMIFDDVTCQIAAVPVGITEAQLLAAMDLDDANFLPGAALDTLTANADFLIDGGAEKPRFSLTSCSITDASLVYGRAKRIGELTWSSSRSVTTGALDPLWVIDWSYTAPEA